MTSQSWWVRLNDHYSTRNLITTYKFHSLSKTDNNHAVIMTQYLCPENGLKWQTSHDTELHESQKDLSSIGARCGVKMLFQSYNRPCRWLHLKQWILNYIDIGPSPHFKNLTCKMGLSAKLFLWKSLSRQNPCDCLRFKTGALFALNMAY